MHKLLGLFSACALVGVAAGVNGAGATPPSGQFSSTEYGRAQQIETAKVVAPSGHDVESSTYTLRKDEDGECSGQQHDARARLEQLDSSSSARF